MKTHQGLPPVSRTLLLLAAWLSAVLTESVIFLGSAGGRSAETPLLCDLSAPAAMSFPRMVLITAAAFAALLFARAMCSRYAAGTRKKHAAHAGRPGAGKALSRRLFTATVRLLPALLFAVLSVLWLIVSFSPGFLGGCILAEIILIAAALTGQDRRPESCPKGVHPRHSSVPSCADVSAGKRSSRLWPAAASMLAVLFFAFISVWTVCRIYTFSTPAYDFGIFSQMFHSIKETGRPLTTLERGGLLSHFAVHVSPIYYLMLPFYLLFPCPATLQVLQALVMALAVHPLWKLAKHRGLSAPLCTIVCAGLLCFPAFAGGAGYDLHENCFLTVLLLWLLCFIDRDRPLPAAVFAVVTLLVKEDAAVYVAVIGLWLMLRALYGAPGGDCPAGLSAVRSCSGPACAAPVPRSVPASVRRFLHTLRVRRFLTGLFLFTAAVLYFLWVTAWLAGSGDGVMTGRYDNLIYDGSGSLLTVIKTVLLCPMKVLFECTDADKLPFIALTLLPLLGLPLATRRYERLVLLIPYVLIHLMPDYVYMHRLFFQYGFGTTALLFYLTAANLADLPARWLRTAAAALAALACAFLFSFKVVPKGMDYPARLIGHSAYYREMRDQLGIIPDGASVACTTFLSTGLSSRSELYDIPHCSKEHVLSADWVAIGPDSSNDFLRYADPGKNNGTENFLLLLQQNGYSPAGSPSGPVLLFFRESAGH